MIVPVVDVFGQPDGASRAQQNNEVVWCTDDSLPSLLSPVSHLTHLGSTRISRPHDRRHTSVGCIVTPQGNTRNHVGDSHLLVYAYGEVDQLVEVKMNNPPRDIYYRTCTHAFKQPFVWLHTCPSIEMPLNRERKQPMIDISYTALYYWVDTRGRGVEVFECLRGWSSPDFPHRPRAAWQGVRSSRDTRPARPAARRVLPRLKARGSHPAAGSPRSARLPR
jgi:hypothetical protein